MPPVRLYGTSPTEDPINDVEFDYAPLPDDTLEFETRDGDNVKYRVVSRLHKFGPQETPGTGMLAIKVKELSSAKSKTTTVKGMY